MQGEVTTFVKEYGLLIVGMIIGIGLVVYGLWDVIVPHKPVVEIIKEGERTSEIVVDVAGAVYKPGVYKLTSGSRIGDVLVLAGGLSAEADREWVGRTLNLASEMKDGQKLYIPKTSEKSEKSGGQTVIEAKSQSGKININKASAGELDDLEGIGEVRAQAIIANRPYGGTDELVSKAKILQSVYEKIKDRLTVY